MSKGLSKSDIAWIEGNLAGYQSGWEAAHSTKDFVPDINLTLEENSKIINSYSVNPITDFLMAVLDRIREETEYNQGGH